MISNLKWLYRLHLHLIGRQVSPESRSFHLPKTHIKAVQSISSIHGACLIRFRWGMSNPQATHSLAQPILQPPHPLPSLQQLFHTEWPSLALDTHLSLTTTKHQCVMALSGLKPQHREGAVQCYLKLWQITFSILTYWPSTVLWTTKNRQPCFLFW